MFVVDVVVFVVVVVVVVVFVVFVFVVVAFVVAFAVFFSVFLGGFTEFQFLLLLLFSCFFLNFSSLFDIAKYGMHTKRFKITTRSFFTLLIIIISACIACAYR